MSMKLDAKQAKANFNCTEGNVGPYLYKPGSTYFYCMMKLVDERAKELGCYRSNHKGS